MAQYHLFRLGNGLPCVFRRSEDVGYCGFVVGAGSRDDGDSYGLAHFVEHTIFKGTTHRRSWHISSRMESIGGELNAYTTKEETVVHTVFPAGYSARALELLHDLAANSVFPPAELEKEREVVIDEINSYLDSPGETVFDEFEDLLFAGSSPGHNILGTPESVRCLGSDECRSFLSRYYAASNMALYCMDDCTPEKAYSAMERHFGSLPAGTANRHSGLLPLSDPFDDAIDRHGHQAHTVLGTRIGTRYDDDRYALFLLNNHLGGPAMNSLLNRELREKRGYVYTVDSSVNLMSDCGLFQVYMGCDREHVAPCMAIVKRLLASIADTPMKPAVFERVKRQYLGQLAVSIDNRESMAISMGRSLLCYGRILDSAYVASRVREVTPEQVRVMAERICNAGLSRLTIM